MNEYLKKEIEKYILSNLGVTKEEFLSWNTKDYSCDKDVYDEFADNISNSTALHVFGDYDCDGICSTYIMSKLLERLTGVVPSCHLPGRASDGYGLKPHQIEKIYKEDEKDLKEGKKITIVTVDNGIVAHEAIKKAKELGYNVVVTDHHIAEANTLNADLVIDPKVKGCNPFPFDGYCGAGVAFKLCEASNAFTKEELFDLKSFAALATIADVMPLIEENHAIVKNVLNEFKTGRIPYSLKLLLDKSNTQYNSITERDFGFLLCPIINAAGRMLDNGAKIAFDYLKEPTEEKAEYLIDINEKRKQVVKEEYEHLLPDVKKAVSEIKEGFISPLFIADNVHKDFLFEGIIGILAGRFCEEFTQPVAVLTHSSDDIYKGSARSVDGFSIYDYLKSLNDEHPEWFAGFGGHEGAAGLSVYSEYIAELLNRRDVFELDLSTIGKESKEIKPIKIKKEDIPEAYKYSELFAPFGEGNPSPLFQVYFHRFYDRPVMIGKNKDIMMYKDKEEHFKIKCFDFISKIPSEDLKKINLIGELCMDSFFGFTAPTLSVTQIEDFDKQKELSSTVEVLKEPDDLDKEDKEEFVLNTEYNNGEIDYSE